MAKKTNKGGRPRTKPKAPVQDRAIGSRIRARRTEIGMSQTDLGKKIGRHVAQIYRYEDGTTSLTLPALTKIATALGCTVEYLAGFGVK